MSEQKEKMFTKALDHSDPIYQSARERVGQLPTDEIIDLLFVYAGGKSALEKIQNIVEESSGEEDLEQKAAFTFLAMYSILNSKRSK